ncbi:larval cuticle protein 65Ab1 [Drosophila virilis]|uniref:Cuticle protein n=1 Tax=Drosophila virilis TaxID=7244 RepID=B4LHF3_DROVI|nr:larval cuticle protein 65Ab1 [Drosophila virilis]EDW68483.1 uncharacterized protein Dvir_GJ12741 [Drosophila virilis]
MKFIILFAAFFALACAAPNDVVIKDQRLDVEPEKWSFNSETSDGANAQQSGVLINPGSDHESIAVKGSYEHIGPDGVKYTVNYVADENGFQPEGAHIPKADY